MTVRDATDADVVRLAASGWTYAEVARLTGRTASNVRYLAKRAGLPKRRGGKPHGHQSLPDEALVETARLYQEGLSLAEVAARLGISERAVLHRLDRAGVPRRSRGEALALAYRKGRPVVGAVVSSA